MIIPVLLLFGPTASGKTSLLEKLYANFSNFFPNKAPGKSRNGINGIEIISADSMQVYRGMDIGTAKPSMEERRKIPHHLIDILDPNEQFNAGAFVRLAEEAIRSIFSRGALPVVSGGTGFYLKNLIMGMSEAPPADEKIRNDLKKELSDKGASSLMEELARADPISAERIHINDEYRLLRALEVLRIGGKPLSSYSSPWTGKETASLSSKPMHFRDNFCFLLLGLRRSRKDLYERINERCAAMFKTGLIDEVENLYKKGYTPFHPGLRAIGYREFFVEDPCSTGELGSWRLSQDYKGIEALVAQNSRRYAKRQITFFSSIPNVRWLDLREDTDFEDPGLVKELGSLLDLFSLSC